MELGPVEPNNGPDEALGRQGRATDSEAEAGGHVHQILPLDCEVRYTMGNDISTISGPESGVSVWVTVNEAVHVW